MVRLVIDNHQIACIGHFTQHFARISLFALDSSLVHAALLGYLLFAIPVQDMPVSYEHTALTQLVPEVPSASHAQPEPEP